MTGEVVAPTDKTKEKHKMTEKEGDHDWEPERGEGDHDCGDCVNERDFDFCLDECADGEGYEQKRPDITKEHGDRRNAEIAEFGLDPILWGQHFGDVLPSEATSDDCKDHLLGHCAGGCSPVMPRPAGILECMLSEEVRCADERDIQDRLEADMVRRSGSPRPAWGILECMLSEEVRCADMSEIQTQTTADGKLLSAWCQEQDWSPERGLAACAAVVSSIALLLESEVRHGR